MGIHAVQLVNQCRDLLVNSIHVGLDVRFACFLLKQAPRRSCCRVNSWSQDSIELQLSDCQAGETLLTSSLHS